MPDNFESILPSTGQSFIDKVRVDAMMSQSETRVPASVTLAQACLESGYGGSDLSRLANNYFGIKGTGPAGSVTMPTQEYVNGRMVTVNAAFRKYNTPSESFADHGWFLRNNSRYANAFNYTGDAARFAQEIHRAGYATDPQYASKLTSLINQYGLTRFDAQPVPLVYEGSSIQCPVLLIGGSSYAPLRKFYEQLGFRVDWDGRVKVNGQYISFTHWMDNNSRTWARVVDLARFVTFNATWDGTNRRIVITEPGRPAYV